MAAARRAAPVRERQDPPPRGIVAWIAVLLVLATVAAYEPVRSNGFINYDDGVYITENPHVQEGLSRSSFLWAFNVGYGANWHPLTWLSHMLDCELWELAPAPHHLTNLALHAASVLVLFLTLFRMTKRTGPSAFVAGIFALHPLHVESVAWAAERKDVLSTLLAFLTLSVWHRWTESEGRGRYLLALGLYALSLTAKPMHVTLPFVMLLLDRWPLERWQKSGPIALLQEKVPFFGLALLSSVMTFIAQTRGKAVTSVEVIPLGPRFANAAVSYVEYLLKTVWPEGLAIFYPHVPSRITELKVAGCVLLLAILTFACLRRFSQRPWLAVGWLWYLGTLVPVIGIVQVGLQSMADRYSYFPMIGVSIAVAFGAEEALRRLHGRGTALAVAAVACLLACLVLTRRQVALWKDDLSVFGHAAAVTVRNPLAHYRLGYALALIGRKEEALAQYRESLKINPRYADPYNQVGLLLQETGKLDEAIATFRRALELKPDLAEPQANLGNALDEIGRSEEGERELRAALQKKPEMPEAHNDLGVLLAKQNRVDEAIGHLQEAVRLRRRYADAHMNLAKALSMRGRMDEAVENLREVLRIDPERAEARAVLQAVEAQKAKEAAAAPAK